MWKCYDNSFNSWVGGKNIVYIKMSYFPTYSYSTKTKV